MVVEFLCECDELPPHSHVYRHNPVANVQGRIVAMRTKADPFDVRISVDWKALARELMEAPSAT